MSVVSISKLLFTGGVFLSVLGCEEYLNKNGLSTAVPRSPSQSRTLDLGYQPLSSAGLLSVAICNDSRFRKELGALGWNLDCTPLLSGSEIARGIDEGWLDGGVTTDIPTIESCEGGAVKVLSLMDQSYMSIVSKSPLPLFSLIGKRIAYHANIPVEHIQSILQSRFNLDLNAIHLIPYKPEFFAIGLEKNDFDAIATWEPLSSLLLEQHPDWQYTARTLGNNYLTVHALLYQDSAIVRALLRSQIRQIQMLGQVDYRLKTESLRWSAASEVDFPPPAPTSMKLLAEHPTNFSFTPSAYALSTQTLKPSNQLGSIWVLQKSNATGDMIRNMEQCLDTLFYAKAMHSLAHEVNP